VNLQQITHYMRSDARKTPQRPVIVCQALSPTRLKRSHSTWRLILAPSRRRRTDLPDTDSTVWTCTPQESSQSKSRVFTRDSICYSAYMLSPVRPSVTRAYHRKTGEVRIMKFSLYGSPIPLVFREQVSSQNSQGFPQSGGVKWGWGR